MSFFNQEQRKGFVTQLTNSTDTIRVLESQIKAKDQLEQDLARTNAEIDQLKKEIRSPRPSLAKDHQPLAAENEKLRREIKKLRKASYQPSQNYVNEYQVFLKDLEKSIKRAKKKSFHQKDSGKKEPKKKSKSELLVDSFPNLSSKKRKKERSKYDFYKNKYSGKHLSPDLLKIDQKQNKSSRDLTYLYGITEEVQRILNQYEIFIFTNVYLKKLANV